jgi:hypothetical protein
MSYFKRIISLFLIAFFLLGGSGIHIYRSFCNLTGESSLELFANQDPCSHDNLVDKQVQHSCCESSSELSFQKKKCCDEEQITLKVNLPYSIQKVNLLLGSLFVPFSKKVDFVSSSVIQISKSNYPFKYYPPSGKERLFLLATLRI